MLEHFEQRPVEGAELRIETRGLSKVIRGYAIMFDRMSENLGGFREIIKPEAMDRTLREGIDLRALVDHDTAKPIGRLSAGTLRVQKDQRGLLIEVDPPDTSYAHDIVESIRRRDVTGMSFGFRTIGEDWNDKTDPPTRSVTDMVVREVSIVTFPAYPSTEVALRSLAAHRRRTVPTIAELQAALEKRRAGWR
jgi:HK97 family phage prohead protease